MSFIATCSDIYDCVETISENGITCIIPKHIVYLKNCDLKIGSRLNQSIYTIYIPNWGLNKWCWSTKLQCGIDVYIFIHNKSITHIYLLE